ncbi:unnamed protein product [Adineta ricciae]|uniref:Uncharacterized protein n=1 Tax=Adineta ricciae TaxID=249248 RepID=A0A813S3P7_ADIRI|nr:unnamed protein product [Adineta ricciae]
MIVFYTLISFFICFYRPVSTLSCYECVSTFPGDNVCLPECSQTTQLNSTCLLTRDVSLDHDFSGSVRAGHINNEPFIFDAVDKYFIFGEEAVYQNPSVAVNWDWEYGPITYGCDTPGCNNPQYVNSLPNALNARIPNETLDRLLTGTLDSSCYVCDECLDEDVSMTNMSSCQQTLCPQHTCNFVATRSSTTGPAQCDGGWHFTSGCILSNEPAQVQMSIMYYIRSKTKVIYQLEATCHSDNCNNFTTFRQLKNDVTVDPDLTCLTSITTTTSLSTSSVSTSSTSSSSTATGSTSTTTRTSSSGGGSTSTSTSASTSTTSAPSSAKQVLINVKFIILTFLSLYIIKF